MDMGIIMITTIMIITIIHTLPDLSKRTGQL
jgi:hypothetical protein